VSVPAVAHRENLPQEGARSASGNLYGPSSDSLATNIVGNLWPAPGKQRPRDETKECTTAASASTRRITRQSQGRGDRCGELDQAEEQLDFLYPGGLSCARPVDPALSVQSTAVSGRCLSHVTASKPSASKKVDCVNVGHAEDRSHWHWSGRFVAALPAAGWLILEALGFRALSEARASARRKTSLSGTSSVPYRRSVFNADHLKRVPSRSALEASPLRSTLR
jgi:hypothetical protein